MNEKEPTIGEFVNDDAEGIPTKDKRRFDKDGERIEGAATETAKEPIKSARELELEIRLKAETERREAAETKLVSVQAKFDEAKASLEKETAEMRSRLMKTLEDRSKQGQFNFLTALLPILDNLNRAVKASETDPSIDNLRTGVHGTARLFEQALVSVGVEPIPAVGSAFDPELHEAVDLAPSDAESDGIITQEYDRGYKFGERLLRPAKVQVGKFTGQ